MHNAVQGISLQLRLLEWRPELHVSVPLPVGCLHMGIQVPPSHCFHLACRFIFPWMDMGV